MKKAFTIILVVSALLGGVAVTAKPKSLQERVTENALTTPIQPAEISPAQLTGPVAQTTSFKLAVPDFEVDTYGGARVRLSDLAKDKPTIIGFWATWCPNCIRNMPVLNNYYQTYRRDVNIILVNLNESRETINKFLNKNSFSFNIAYDEDGTVSRAYGINYTNTHVLLGRDGQLIEAFPGDVDESHFQKLLSS